MLGLVLALLLSGPTAGRPATAISATTASRPALVSRVRVVRPRAPTLRARGRVHHRQARVGRRIVRQRGR